MFVSHGIANFSKNLGVRWVKGSKVHKRNLKILSLTVQNLVTTAKRERRNLNTSVVHAVLGHRLTKKGPCSENHKEER
jgi:hypothetical protein